MAADERPGINDASSAGDAFRPLLDELRAMGVRFREWLDTPVDLGGPKHAEGTLAVPPLPAELEELKRFSRGLKANSAIKVNSPAFGRMLTGLPRGRHLPDWAKQDLWALFEFAEKIGDAELGDTLFEIRFGLELDDRWTKRTKHHDVALLWETLERLPDAHVEGNDHLRAVIVDEANEFGGWYGGSTVAIAEQTISGQPHYFEDVVQHEIGHAVHAKNKAVVDDWLRTRFGWLQFGATAPGIDAWAELMDGWGGAGWRHRRQIRIALLAALGPGRRKGPACAPEFPREHPWHSNDCGLRLAFRKSPEYWYLNFAKWHRANDHAFFMNYWEGRFMAVATAALDLVARLPSPYAAASPMEFFAELYELHYDLDDPRRAVIPADVAAWLDAEIGPPDVASPRWREDKKVGMRSLQSDRAESLTKKGGGRHLKGKR